MAEPAANPPSAPAAPAPIATMPALVAIRIPTSPTERPAYTTNRPSPCSQPHTGTSAHTSTADPATASATPGPAKPSASPPVTAAATHPTTKETNTAKATAVPRPFVPDGYRRTAWASGSGTSAATAVPTTVNRTCPAAKSANSAGGRRCASTRAQA